MLNIRILCQESIIREMVSRQCRSFCGSPDIDVFRKILMMEYLMNEKEHLAEKSDFVPEVPVVQGGVTSEL